MHHRSIIACAAVWPMRAGGGGWRGGFGFLCPSPSCSQDDCSIWCCLLWAQWHEVHYGHTTRLYTFHFLNHWRHHLETRERHWLIEIRISVRPSSSTCFWYTPNSNLHIQYPPSPNPIPHTLSPCLLYSRPFLPLLSTLLPLSSPARHSLASWKSTSLPLRAFLSRLVMIFSCMICWRIVMSGLVMSISTSGLLIWLARPSPITSGRYLDTSIHHLAGNMVAFLWYYIALGWQSSGTRPLFECGFGPLRRCMASRILWVMFLSLGIYLFLDKSIFLQGFSVSISPVIDLSTFWCVCLSQSRLIFSTVYIL